MALKLKKEVKKSSYYVWFLGAKESKGLRGLEYILPVIDNLEERERDVEPFKVTLQVSAKGLKIVQNIVSAASGGSKKPKSETIKHFIPHNTIACVHQREDVIACILLLFNPVTKCPLHVHAYRCDSLETASVLRAQLQLLIERPENQKKLAEIEGRLRPTSVAPATAGGAERRAAKAKESSVGSSDTGASVRSESSEERYASEVRVATLYDSVAAELRAKLNRHDVPILLPPRDYDTVHRQKGNLAGIELRRCLNANIVGQQHSGKAKRMASSGGSSGIGSDHAPSPESPDVQERYHDGHSTSDEDWNADHDTGLYLIDQPTYPSPLPKYDYRVERRTPRQFDQQATRQRLEEHIRQKLEQRNKHHHDDALVQYRNERNRLQPAPERSYDGEREHQERQARFSRVEETLKRAGRPGKEMAGARPDRERRYREPSAERDAPDNLSVLQFSPRERFHDAKEKFLLLEKKAAPVGESYARKAPASPNSCKNPRHSKYYDEEPTPAPRTDRIGGGPFSGMLTDKYDAKRRSMFNLPTAAPPAGDRDRDRGRAPDRDCYYAERYAEDAARTLSKEYRRRSDFDEAARAAHKSGAHARDARELKDTREYVQVREKKFPPAQRYRNSYAEPEGRQFAPGGAPRTRYDILHRANSTVSNNGRVGIASVHPY